MTLSSSARKYATDFLSFVESSPTPFHAVHSAKAMLSAAGFIELSERDNWASLVELGKSYFTTRNGTSLIAFGVGGKWSPGNAISIVGAHTDSPCLRVKPVSKKTGEGYLSVGVELYGGGIWHTWFDRDLCLAGRVITSSGKDKFDAKLFRSKKPILRIPTLAIHLDGTVNQKLEFNKETNFQPILALAKEALGANEGSDISVRHHSGLLSLIAEELSLASVQEIQDFELLLHDAQPPSLGGLYDEFIFSARLDNLDMTFCAIRGLIESGSQSTDETIRMISLFDHEEIGSLTAQGADSNFLPSVIKRLAQVGGNKNTSLESPYERSLSKSFLLSADMAHAVNPNYSNKYEDSHKPALNGGPVIKINANARYATNTPGIVLIEECAKRAQVQLQRFVVRNDSSCGSTIGNTNKTI